MWLNFYGRGQNVFLSLKRCIMWPEKDSIIKLVEFQAEHYLEDIRLYVAKNHKKSHIFSYF